MRIITVSEDTFKRLKEVLPEFIRYSDKHVRVENYVVGALNATVMPGNPSSEEERVIEFIDLCNKYEVAK